jgi:hypothetical protein
MGDTRAPLPANIEGRVAAKPWALFVLPMKWAFLDERFDLRSAFLGFWVTLKWFP